MATDAAGVMKDPSLRSGCRFITFEGIDGSGKTTQLRKVAAMLDNPLITKEPGGTPTADRIRAVLLDQTSKLDPVAEVLLFAASRRQNVIDVIRPALDAGRTVLCDRYRLDGAYVAQLDWSGTQRAR